MVIFGAKEADNIEAEAARSFNPAGMHTPTDIDQVCKADLRNVQSYTGRHIRRQYKKVNKKREKMFTQRWVPDGIAHTGTDRRKTSLHSELWASWWLVMCFLGAAKLTAALPPEQNDIVCSLSLHSSSSYTRSLPLLFFARLLAA